MNDPGFQSCVQDWTQHTFGPEDAYDVTMRNHRFLEESLELVQALGCTASEAHQLADYVFGRPVGDPAQEVGGVMVTLAALCAARGLDMERSGRDELARVWQNVDKIRAKHASKPKHSPLPAPMGMSPARPVTPLDLLERYAEWIEKIRVGATGAQFDTNAYNWHRASLTQLRLLLAELELKAMTP